MTISKRNLILLGPPGVGKGTLAEKLVAQESLAHISTGSLLRAEVEAETELGLQAKGAMASGGLVSDELVAKIISEFLAKPNSVDSGFILDGFPRNLAQAEILDKELASQDLKIDAIVYIEAPESLLLERITSRLNCPSCGAIFNKLSRPPKENGVCDKCQAKLIQRKDDTLETAQARLALYAQATEPLIEYYNKSGLVVTVDGVKELDEKLTLLTKDLS